MLMSSSWPKQWQSSFTNVDDLLKYVKLSRLDLPILTDFTEFPFKVPRPFVERMKKGDPNDPLLLQVLPITAELLENPGFSKNPLKEDAVNPVSGLLHKYASRVLLTLSGSCAINCRYCFRRHFPYDNNNPGTKGWDNIFDYLREHSEVNEVILSGGDPLSTNDAVLKRFIQHLESLESVQYLRFHTRLPIVIPDRVTEDLLLMLHDTRFRVSMVLHTNHANEWDESLRAPMRALHDANVTLLNQSVLLRGINNSVSALSNLSYRLYDFGVLPYYLHLLDKVSGASHFDVNADEAIILMRALIESLPGYLVPRLVREVPTYRSKVPVDFLFNLKEL